MELLDGAAAHKIEWLAVPLAAWVGIFLAAALVGHICSDRLAPEAAAEGTRAREDRKEEEIPLKSIEDPESRATEAEKQERPPAEVQKIAKVERVTLPPLWQGVIVLAFISCGAAQALAVSVAKGSRETLGFDSSAAVTCSEALKLAVALGVLLGGGDRSALRCPPPREWFSESLDILVVACLFAFQNEMNYLAIQYLGAVLFVLLGSSLKIVFTVSFMRLLLGKEFASLQWVAVLILMISATISQVPNILGEEAKGENLSVGLPVMLMVCISAGFAPVRNELIFKRERKERMPFMLQNAVMYVWGVGLNLGSWALWGKHAFFEGFTAPVWVSVLSAASFGIMVAMMLKYLDNAVRCFSGVGQVLFTVLVSRLLPAQFHKGHFDAFYLAALVSLAVALVLYQAHAQARLPVMLACAFVVSLVIGLGCMWLDRHIATQVVE